MRFKYCLPESFREVPAGQQLGTLDALLGSPDAISGQIEAIRRAAKIPMSIWRKLRPVDRTALLERCRWVHLQPSAVALFEDFKHRGTVYLAPADNFTNGTCMEYPLADEYCTRYLDRGDPADLLHLTATLYREADPDTAVGAARDDFRVLLSSRAEIGQRAKRMANLPNGLQMAALLYFIGVKELIKRLYGSWLFKEEELDEDTDSTSKGDPLGWWGLYLDAARQDVTKLDEIHRSNFHNFCLMEVRRRKQIKEAEQRRRLQSKNA